MSGAVIYLFGGVGLFVLGLHAALTARHPLRKLLGANITGSGVFLVLIAGAARAEGAPDPVPHALVLTGIVVAVSMTALGLVLMTRLPGETAEPERRE